MSEKSQSESKSEIKSLKDIKSLDDFKEDDFAKMELIRGQTPPDIEVRCLQLCKDYLSGNWCQQTVDTIEVRRVSGGFINQLYYCGIKEPDDNNNQKVPQEVAIRLYGQSLVEKSRTRDVVIALTLSEKNLGPKIYGLFEGGQIQQFYKHRQFKEEEQKTPLIRDSVFKALAKVHCLDVPINKQNNIMVDLLNKCYREAFEKFPIQKEIEEYNCKLLKACDLKAEVDLALRVAERADSPLIFTHNDFRSSNLMIAEPNDQLIVCDFDITGYGYRGYDFVDLSREWGRNQFDMHTPKGIWFDEDLFKSLIEIYVEECVRIKGKSYSENPINSVEHILKEVKSCLLLSVLFNALYFISEDETNDDFPFNRKVCLQFAEKGMETYYSVKEALKEQNLIK